MEANAQLTIDHSGLHPDTLKSLLEHNYSRPGTDATTEAIKAAKLPAEMKGSVLYGCKLNDRAVIFFHQSQTQLMVMVCHLRGEPYHVTQSTWDGINSTLKNYKPKLSSAKLEDKYGMPYAIGNIGAKAAISKDIPRIVPILVAIAAIMIVIFGASTAAVQVPAWIAGAVSLVLIIKDARATKIVWSTPRI